MNQRSSRLLLAATIASVVLAGCAGAGGSKRDGPAYKGEFKEFDLYLVPLTASGGSAGWELYPGAYVDAWVWSFDPSPAKASVPGPTIRVREGDTVRVNFYILGTPMSHTIHWHGIHLPWNMDGVPYVSQLPIGDKAFGGNGDKVTTYEFQVNQSGTYWYHCHVDTAHHMDMGMYGAFIVDPADPNQDPPFDREATLMLDEWDRSHAHQNANAITAAVSKSGDPRVTANDVYAASRDYLLMNQVYNDTVAGGALRNAPGVRETRDWYPVTYAPYFAEYDTFLINGRAAPLTEPIFVKQGETLRMRLVNAGSQVHSMHLHGHHVLVTHKDGYLLPAPYYADTILIGPGERYDVYMKADNPGPWMLHDHIALNEANDFISPGGMMTMICYTDGWEVSKMCQEGQMRHDQGEPSNVGDLFRDQYAFLKSKEIQGAMVSEDPEPALPSQQVPAPIAPSAPGTGGLPVPVQGVDLHH